MAPNIHTDILNDENLQLDDGQHETRTIRAALLGCGMMGQEHISYMLGYSNVSLDFLCDPHEPSLKQGMAVFQKFYSSTRPMKFPELLSSEEELLQRADEIDLLVIATPDHLHTDTIIRWGTKNISILCEKPVAVSMEQHARLSNFVQSADFRARVWVAMEYRYIPAIAKLVELLPTIGDVKMVTIRENRFPFLDKVAQWNRDRTKTGDSLVEKCCHFFDLFRLISGMEVDLTQIKSLVQRGLNYQDEDLHYDVPIIDSAYVIFPFEKSIAMGSLELTMFADGSRHREEIVVTGTKGRVEAYLPENKVYAYRRPTAGEWVDRTVPPPSSAIHETVYDCSNVREIHGIKNEIPTHGGYHYSSTAVEWHRLVSAIGYYHETGAWNAEVTINDGLEAVRIGLAATDAM
ncbi:hypothetical protein ACA910_005809 [Epithemia clementina (nom. ined.)]